MPRNLMTISPPPSPQTLSTIPFFLVPNPNFSKGSFLHPLELPSHSRPWQPPQCYGQPIKLATTQKPEFKTSWILSPRVHPSIGKLTQDINNMDKEFFLRKTGNWSMLESPPPALLGWVPCTGYHRGQRSLVRNHWESRGCLKPIRFKGNLGDTLNTFRLKSPGKCFQDTAFHSRRAVLFSVAHYSTWEDPSPSQKENSGVYP